MKTSTEPTITELLASLKAKLLAERSRIDRLLTAMDNCEETISETTHVDGTNNSGLEVTTYRSLTPRRKYQPRQPRTDTVSTAVLQDGVMIKTATQAAAEAVTAELEAPATFGGAMKRVLREAPNPISSATIWATIKTNWQDLLTNRGEDNIEANLRYWVNKGHAEKLGAGSLATYKVIDHEFFKEVEA